METHSGDWNGKGTIEGVPASEGIYAAVPVTSHDRGERAVSILAGKGVVWRQKRGTAESSGMEAAERRAKK